MSDQIQILPSGPQAFTAIAELLHRVDLTAWPAEDRERISAALHALHIIVHEHGALAPAGGAVPAIGMSATAHAPGAKTHDVQFDVSSKHEGPIRVALGPLSLERLIMQVLPEGVEATDARVAPLRVLQQRCYDEAAAKGWHDDDSVTIGDRIALMHSELSEVLEEHRNGHAPTFTYVHEGYGYVHEGYGNLPIEFGPEQMEFLADWSQKPLKPEGIPIEMADLIIRALDFCGKYNIDVAEAVERKLRFNQTRAHKHGGKKL
jgi:hypothetical protein